MNTNTYHNYLDCLTLSGQVTLEGFERLKQRTQLDINLGMLTHSERDKIISKADGICPELYAAKAGVLEDSSDIVVVTSAGNMYLQVEPGEWRLITDNTF